jgi:hypothetical protein
MLGSMLKLFTEGDVNEARSHLLHSTAWIQHQLTAYGDEQISRCWMVWLSQCGLSTCEEQVTVASNGQSFDLLTLKPENADFGVRIGLWSWNNGNHVKRLVCQVDTALLALATGQSEEELARVLPEADPLLISDYDQQQHPHSISVAPGDLVALDERVAGAVAGWWALWQDMQLANLERVYATDARIQVPGMAGDQGVMALRRFCSDWFMRMRRRFCQPESMLVDERDPGKLAMLWHMEGDMSSVDGVQRVRVPMVNLIQVADGKIVRDSLLLDAVAVAKKLA